MRMIYISQGFVKLSVYLHIMDSQKDSKGPVPNLIDRFSGGLKGNRIILSDIELTTWILP